jgi:hypothetical protein
MQVPLADYTANLKTIVSKFKVHVWGARTRQGRFSRAPRLTPDTRGKP